MQRRTTPPRTTARRLIAAAVALLLGVGFAVAGATAAQAGVLGISIQSTGATTQPSGSEFQYQVNVSCSATATLTCDNSVIRIPLDPAIGMPDWGYDVTGGPAGYVQDVSVVGDELVITLQTPINAGTSTALALSVTPPNLTTPHATTWTLLPTMTSDEAPVTAPSSVTGTATATVPLTVGKSSDATFYEEGDQITYTLSATCPADAQKPPGSVYADSMTLTDLLPPGLTYVSSTPAATVDPGTGELSWSITGDDLPSACGGEAGTVSIQVTATVGSVGTDPDDDFTPYQQVGNTVNVTATPRGGGDQATGTATRDVVVIEEGAAPIPGTHSINKGSSAPLNRAPNGSDPDRRATYPGRWLPNGDNSARPASVNDPSAATYTISPRIQYPSFQYEIRDKVPCLDDFADPFYTQSAGLCANPAFHVLAVRVEYSGATHYPAEWAPQYLRASDGSTGTMTLEVGDTGWRIPDADLGDVAELIFPRDESQETRLADNIRVYGYADPSTDDGEILRNQASIAWYLEDATTVIDDGGTQTSGNADIFIVNTPQLGLNKTMTELGGPAGTQAQISLTATLFSPGVPTEDLVLTDLLPPDTTLATDPTTITATLTRPGGADLALSNGQLVVVVIADHLPGRDLLRITIPATEIPDESGQFTVTIAPLVVDKPTAPGLYPNTGNVFYDDADLSSTCATGSQVTEDPDGLRGNPDASETSCVSSATFRTATSGTSDFEILKTVQGPDDPTPLTSPGVAHVALTNGVGQFVITWTNTGTPTLEGVVLYDVLPHPGDVGVIGSQAGVQRLSEFRPLLATTITGPAEVTVEYSASENPCRSEVYPGQPAGCDNDWSADPDTLGGLGNVLSFRITSSGAYVTGEGFQVEYGMTVPTADADKVAWNSVAAYAQTTTGIAMEPTESPKVGITAPADPTPPTPPGGVLGTTGSEAPTVLIIVAVLALATGTTLLILRHRRPTNRQHA